jgi:uncharacterized protein (DUF433 family)
MTPLTTKPILHRDEKGAIRIGESRVTLDVILEDYYAGHSPQTIAANYPSISLADVHEAIAYALRHPRDVKEYLERRKEEAELLRHQIESGQSPNSELRARLLARKSQGGPSDASSAD